MEQGKERPSVHRVHISGGVVEIIRQILYASADWVLFLLPSFRSRTAAKGGLPAWFAPFPNRAHSPNGYFLPTGTFKAPSRQQLVVDG